MKIFALYKGEENLTDGTAKELADYLNVNVKTIYFYKSNAYKRRFKENSNNYIVIEIEENDERKTK